jgi:hypothetical protein
MKTIAASKIDYWRRLSASATPGPWALGASIIVGAGETVVRASYAGDEVSILVFGSKASRDFILAAREALPALLAEREVFVGHLRDLGVVLRGAPDEQDEAEWQVAQRER